MRDLPILFSGAMVRALLDGRKTQTRRVMKPQPPVATTLVQTWHHPGPRTHFWASDGASLLDWTQPCPYVEVGDRLYVRETHRPVYPQDPAYNGGEPIEYDYKATYRPGDRLIDPVRWTPSIHMPRAASRILLEVTSARVERLLDISEVDARAEGARECDPASGREVILSGPSRRGSYVLHYRDIWDGLNATRGYGWDVNPWVWVVNFRIVK